MLYIILFLLLAASLTSASSNPKASESLYERQRRQKQEHEQNVQIVKNLKRGHLRFIATKDGSGNTYGKGGHWHD